MKKQMVKILALIMMVIALMPMAACNRGVTATPENSYVISVYKEIKTQDEYGAVKTTDYVLWQSFNVVKTQMYLLPGGKDVGIFSNNFYNTGAKYLYISNFSERYIMDGGVKILPSDDATLFVRERQKKNVNFFLNGVNIYNKLSKESKESFKEQYYGVYSEEFDLASIIFYVSEIIETSVSSDKIKFYVGNQREKELEKENFSYYGYTYSGIKLIQSTNVQIVIE